ncbi:hypothetical protein HUS23_12400 [Ectothiorhodospiraceae bacterium 2226]|nr:hypothetical protein HUS23_12400 [Ectothiorhodospiraceae bacterium 2226]
MEPAATPDLELRQRRMAHIVYGLQALSVFIGLIGIVAVVLAYLRRRQGGGSVTTHFTWQIRSFWGFFIASALGSIMVVAFQGFGAGQLGLLLVVAAAIWLIYRVIRGWLGLYDGRPMYDIYPPPPAA